MTNNAKAPVAVIGAGSFGTAIAWVLCNAGVSVKLWCYRESVAQAINETHRNEAFLPHCELTGAVASSDINEVVRGCESAIIATPSFAAVKAAESMADVLDPQAPVLILSKGLDLASGRPLFEAVAEKIGDTSRVAVLSGPNHAEELSKGAFAGAVVASRSMETAVYFQKLLSCPFFRLYASEDPVGVSLCGAAKNVVAIACGMTRGAEFGDNAVSLLMTRGLAEITRLVEACGGSRDTCIGLAGVGDLNATCNSAHSRNGMYGEAFAREGISVKDYEDRRHMVVEGAHAVEPLLALAKEKGVELPITMAVGALLDGSTTLEEIAAGLMAREMGGELPERA